MATGDLHSSGTVSAGTGSEQGLNGSASGQSKNDAEVVVTHAMNGRIGSDTYQFASLHGTLTGGETLGFSGAWDADPAELHANLVRKASENTNGVEGNRTFTNDASGLHWSGETTTQTTNSPDAETTTDKVTNTSWQYDIGPTTTYRHDRTDTSTLTAQQGENEEGEPTQTESIVQTWSETLYDGSITFEYLKIGNPTSSWDVDTKQTTHTKTKEEQGTRSKTTSRTGNKASLNSATDSHRTENDRTQVGVVQYLNEEDTESSIRSNSDSNTHEEASVHESYNSSHTVTPEGLAMGGKFNASVNNSHIRSQSYFAHEDNYGHHPHANLDGTVTYNGFKEKDRKSSTDTTTIAEEHGSYYDRPVAGGGSERAQEGKFSSTATVTTTKKGPLDFTLDRERKRCQEPLIEILRGDC